MQSTKHPRRYLAAALAVAAAAVLLATSGTARAAAADAAAVPVTDIALSADWSASAGGGSSAPAWYAETSLAEPEVIHLEGAARQISTAGATPEIIGILPPGARPDRSVYEVVAANNGTYAEIEIDQFGDISAFSPHSPATQDFSLVSLEGVSFELSVSSVNFAVPLNGCFWQASTGLGSVAPSVWADGSQIVHLQGAVTQISGLTGWNVIGTLPPAFRPVSNVFTIALTSLGTYTDLFISASTGDITIIGARSPATTGYQFVSLDGITYSQGGGTTQVAVNTASYSPTTAYGTFSPSAQVDGFGVVQLSGAVSATTTPGSLLATLPAGLRPDRSVYEIVHTFNGTYADIVITPAGQVNLIDPRSPMVTDLSFVSLEGISYLP